MLCATNCESREQKPAAVRVYERQDCVLAPAPPPLPPEPPTHPASGAEADELSLVGIFAVVVASASGAIVFCLYVRLKRRLARTRLESATRIVGISSSSSDGAIKVFASMRFGSVGVHKHEAPALQRELAKHGIDMFVAAPKAGEDITRMVFDRLYESSVFIAFVTPTDAEDTGNPASTYAEYMTWRQAFPAAPLIPLNMLRKGEALDLSKPGVNMARQLLDSNKAFLSWELGSTRNADGTTTIPPKLVTAICEVVSPSR